MQKSKAILTIIDPFRKPIFSSESNFKRGGEYLIYSRFFSKFDGSRKFRFSPLALCSSPLFSISWPLSLAFVSSLLSYSTRTIYFMDRLRVQHFSDGNFMGREQTMSSDAGFFSLEPILQRCDASSVLI